MKILPCSLSDRAHTAIELCNFDGKQFHLVASDAFAPGQRLTLSAPLPTPLVLQLKSLGSVRRPDGRYDVRARASTLRRDERVALERYFADA